MRFRSKCTSVTSLILRSYIPALPKLYEHAEARSMKSRLKATLVDIARAELHSWCHRNFQSCACARKVVPVVMQPVSRICFLNKRYERPVHTPPLNLVRIQRQLVALLYVYNSDHVAAFNGCNILSYHRP